MLLFDRKLPGNRLNYILSNKKDLYALSVCSLRCNGRWRREMRAKHDFLKNFRIMKPFCGFMCVYSEGGNIMSKGYAGLSYEETVRKYAQNVTSACMMRLQNWADAEDCFQNTFLKLYQKSPDFRDESHLKAWLLRVAINECKNCIRDNRRHLPLDSITDKPAPSDEDSSDLSWALMKLDPPYREVVYLHYAEGYRVHEIADILGKNVNTVKTELRRGREKLKKIYGGEDS